MGSIRFSATLVPRGPAAAVVLDDGQVAAVGEGAMSASKPTSSLATRSMFKLELDTAPREVDLPKALANALAEDSQARAAHERLAYTHRNEYAQWIDDAKRDETRRRRVSRALEMLREGKPWS